MIAQSTTTIRQSDEIAHTPDTRLFWITRNGRAVQRSWNELTATERKQQEQAQNRAAYCAMFDIYN